ncbi:Holliday junction resolvase RuvX [Nitrosovibrio tenuis]|uniref:Putative pre-16S rRNA nuclease n=1 Tax=Nitrosovibrio tenuis TaxID=1233 RepID=A0A1H7G279_9PROT|nr:Holliday junction resolvase RuvX [Nitrosovibrio tenuis]SEK32218.1 putative holliday junction resolvase [Nitrosovibrio tenuis]
MQNRGPQLLAAGSLPANNAAGKTDGAVLAFDFGQKRIGVAVGNLGLGLAHPLATISSMNTVEQFETIFQLIREWQPVLLVVGLPLHADGIEHELTRQSRRFARRLEGRFGIHTVLVDERHTSIDASLALREAGVKGRKQKPMLDQVAAQLILQSYFDGNDATA